MLAVALHRAGKCGQRVRHEAPFWTCQQQAGDSNLHQSILLPSSPKPKRFYDFTSTSGGTFPITGAACADYCVIRHVEVNLWQNFPTTLTRTPTSPRRGCRPRTWRLFLQLRHEHSHHAVGQHHRRPFEHAAVRRRRRPARRICRQLAKGRNEWASRLVQRVGRFGVNGCDPPNDTRPGRQPINVTNDGEVYAFSRSRRESLPVRWYRAVSSAPIFPSALSPGW